MRNERNQNAQIHHLFVKYSSSRAFFNYRAREGAAARVYEAQVAAGFYQASILSVLLDRMGEFGGGGHKTI